MERFQEALANQQLYALCQRLYLQGITPEILAVVRDVPDLAATLPDVISFDELKAAQYDLFGFNLFPYESMFLEDDQLLGSAISESVAENYQRWGYVATQQAGAADHIGEELGLLAHLCAAEADALEDDRPAIARQMQQAQRQFLEDHLLRWLVPFVTAVQRHGHPFYAEVATITLTLVAEHYRSVIRGDQGSDDALPMAGSISAPISKEYPSPVADPRTSLHDIATFLTTTTQCGVYLSRYLINQLGRQHRLPRGFGSRQQMMTNLLRTAAQYDAVPELMILLRAELMDWQRSYESIGARYSALWPFAMRWQARVNRTLSMLAEMEELIAVELSQNGENHQSCS